MVAFISKSQNFGRKLSEYSQKNFNCLKRDPRLFLMRKMARIELVRNLMVNLTKPPSQSYAVSLDNTSIFKDIDVDKAVSALKNDGCYLGLHLPQDIIQEFRQFYQSRDWHVNQDRNLVFSYSELKKISDKNAKKFRFANPYNPGICAPLEKLKTDPVLLAIAAKYLGATPKCVGSSLRWSFPVLATSFEQLKSAQVFHCDLDDYRAIKFFFYLTDVDLSSGPHACIRGTHKNKKLLHQFLGERCANIEDQQLIDDYGMHNVMSICGTEGFGFVEDVLCFHKGTLPTAKERWFLQIEFAINEYRGLRDC